MKIKAAFTGNLKEYMQQQYKNAEHAVTAGIKSTSSGLKLSMRSQVLSSGLGKKMSNTWRSEIYPKGQESLNAAGLVYTRASTAMQGFEKGSVVKSKDGWWLAIPAPKAPKTGKDGKRIKPSNFPESRYGKLRFIYKSSGPSLLVAEKETTGKRKTKPKVMFFLVPQVKMPKLINFEAESIKWFNKLPDEIIKNWKE